MYHILIVLLLFLALLVIAVLGKRDSRKTIEIIGHLSLFALMRGFIGSTVGLIGVFDAIEESGAISQPIMAGGLKVSLLCVLFGLFVLPLAACLC